MILNVMPLYQGGDIVAEGRIAPMARRGRRGRRSKYRK